MTDSIETPYLNLPPNHVERVKAAGKSRESHDREKFLRQLEKGDEESRDRDKQEADTFYRESSGNEESTETKPVIVHKKEEGPVNPEGPGLVIDITV